MTNNTQNMFHASRNSLDLAHYSGINNKKTHSYFLFLTVFMKKKTFVLRNHHAHVYSKLAK